MERRRLTYRCEFGLQALPDEICDGPIKTAELLAAVVEKIRLKFRVVGMEEFRTRRATATNMDISETVLVLNRR